MDPNVDKKIVKSARGGSSDADIFQSNPGHGRDQRNVGKAKIIALGAYLLMMILVSVVGISILMMAETDQDLINCKLNPLSALCPDAGKTNKEATNANTNAAVDGNKNGIPMPSATAAIEPPHSSSNGSKPAGSVSETKLPPPQSGKTDVLASNANGNSNVTPKSSPTPIPNKQQFARVSIPPKEDVYGVGIITADSYVVLIVLFAGMLGAVIRVNYSFYKHLGFGDFSFNWFWFYFLLPFF